jgi:hypothetical protein
MSLVKKIIFSIIPLVSILIIFSIIFYPIVGIKGWHLALSNLLVLTQIIFLYYEFKKLQINRDKILLYTIISVIFLPSQLYIIWCKLDLPKDYK